jgi:ribosomal protein S18 acetylase RimI-like enzyme
MVARMTTWRERLGPPWYGIGGATMRALEVHEARVHSAAPGREPLDLGDAVALFDAADEEPFFNRVAAIRWPTDAAAFEQRLDQVMGLFAARDRQPYLWLAPGFNTPGDLPDRLGARGFADLGGGLSMLLVRDPRDARPRTIPPGTTVERVTTALPDEGRRAVRDAADVIAEAFAVTGHRRPAIEAELFAGLSLPEVDLRLVRQEGQAVAVGRRHGFDGISYLSAIGVRPAWQGDGLGELVTRALLRGAIVDGHELIHLGVHTSNGRARALYERMGFAILGARAPDYLLR